MDIYSFGIVMYELLSGNLPFSGRNEEEVLLQQIYNRPPPLSVDAGLEKIVMRCLEKDPGRRFQTVEEVAGALTHYFAS